jgi:antitoxin component of RelBE/YafQ-DinJ toxin-antitoxin module
MPKHPEQTNVRLDEQAKKDAREIARRYGLNGIAAAIRLALREVARRIEQEEQQ